ncbi:hypothetical protein DFR58_101123 [Anaerobacterium chartisolvens]|uniref:Uncharacterized protein n=1 Tax=Anaerobacterium chartisolvens TaxID=1297424 RepID=A0A369BHN4_9FIRM|nr:hypothetical protein [Anaerobacterium chartisolvens]RCX20921.1 hypothetical protein DFR58_101123 [Anaerobacterium chartisolvens]
MTSIKKHIGKIEVEIIPPDITEEENEERLRKIESTLGILTKRKIALSYK